MGAYAPYLATLFGRGSSKGQGKRKWLERGERGKEEGGKGRGGGKGQGTGKGWIGLSRV